MGKCHVIVGAGTSGIILARFLADKGHDVVIIEESLDEDRKSTHNSGTTSAQSKLFNLHSVEEMWTYQCHNSKYSNLIKSVAQNQLGGRQVLYSRGKGLGGSSNVNAMIFFRGHNEVFDQFWPKLWNASFIAKLEAEVLRIIDFGEVHTSGGMAALISSASTLIQEEGQKKIGKQPPPESQSDSSSHCTSKVVGEDFTTYTTSHRSTMDKCQTKRRQLREVLTPHTTNKEMSIENADTVPITGTISIVKGRVLHVNIVNQEAVSVTTELPSGQTHEIHPANGGEIVLCAGVFITAPLLVKSIKMAKPAFPTGTSPVRDFESGTEVQLPLYDHPVLPCIWWAGWWEGWSSHTVYPVSGVHGWVYLNRLGGLHCPSSANPTSSNSISPPPFQLLFLDGYGSLGLGELLLPRFPLSHAHQHYVLSFYNFIRPFVLALLNALSHVSLLRYIIGGLCGALLCCVQPQSRGSMKISEDGKMEFDPALLRETEDIKGLYNSYLSLKKIVAHWHATRTAKPSSSVLSSLFLPTIPPIQILPGPVFGYCDTFDQFQSFAGSLTSTYFHPCGTLPMRIEEVNGAKEQSVEGSPGGNNHGDIERNHPKGWVVDEYLRVRDVKGLRIADASVIPSIPSSPIAAACMCVGVAAGMFMTESD